MEEISCVRLRIWGKVRLHLEVHKGMEWNDHKRMEWNGMYLSKEKE